jgi:prepilin-type N-terminal cleavage/methylation domain-containing protein
MKSILRKQRGDTIIEVMIAIAIVSGVLGATFAISNKALRTTQANHERFQAQMFANQQAEWIKTYSIENRATLLANTTDFCMVDAATLVSSTDTRCTLQTLYKITITPKATPQYIDTASATVGSNTYYIHIDWDSLSNLSSTDQLELVYGI